MSAGWFAPAGARSRHARRAISPIIATIILIVITVVAGAFLYTYATGMLRSGAASQVANVQSITLTVPNGSGDGTLTVTVQNGGTVAIKGVSLVDFNGSTESKPLISSTTPISPGQSASGSVQVGPNVDSDGVETNGSLIAGESYEVQLNVTFANGQTQIITTTVMANTY
ncbi:hypothetical protein NAS2_0670 [Conexivisphaera calida]|uniref:Archaeal Type IV pilin N-terminal domain-containing protein n=2 Tax=Conexivisphaera calida TaxID=1874277 RepID=A0A4P2VBZ0_9ARCH|nr:hypothetical protein NAS2_0670 [Conexivisphaera calida]